LYDKAVLLYHKGGRIQRALHLCFKAQLFDSLRQIGTPALAVLCCAVL
jgi:hypothetical protein